MGHYFIDTQYERNVAIYTLFHVIDVLFTRLRITIGDLYGYACSQPSSLIRSRTLRGASVARHPRIEVDFDLSLVREDECIPASPPFKVIDDLLTAWPFLFL